MKYRVEDVKVGVGPDQLPCMASNESHAGTSGVWPDEGDKPYTSMELSCVCTDGDPVSIEQDGKTFHGRGLLFGERMVALFGDTVVVQTLTPEGATRVRRHMKSAVIG